MFSDQGHHAEPIRTIVPNYLLHDIAGNVRATHHSRACAARSLIHNSRLLAARQALQNTRNATTPSLIPSELYQQIINSEGTSSDSKLRARKSLALSDRIRAARERGAVPSAGGTPRRLHRVLYDSEHSDDIPGARIRKEGQSARLDSCGKNV